MEVITVQIVPVCQSPPFGKRQPSASYGQTPGCSEGRASDAPALLERTRACRGRAADATVHVDAGACAGARGEGQGGRRRPGKPLWGGDVGAERKAGRRASWGTWQQEQRPRGARARHVRGRLEGGGRGGHEARGVTCARPTRGGPRPPGGACALLAFGAGRHPHGDREAPWVDVPPGSPVGLTVRSFARWAALRASAPDPALRGFHVPLALPAPRLLSLLS